jgi:hypothetical protein
MKSYKKYKLKGRKEKDREEWKKKKKGALV